MSTEHGTVFGKNVFALRLSFHYSMQQLKVGGIYSTP